MTGAPRVDLLGAWRNTTSLQPAGSMERVLIFGADGRFELRIVSRGLYGQPASQLSATSTVTGAYTHAGDRVLLQGESRTDWDSVYYLDAITTDLHNATVLDARFDIQGDELVLYYDSYPADTPVPTTMRLTRIKTTV